MKFCLKTITLWFLLTSTAFPQLKSSFNDVLFIQDQNIGEAQKEIPLSKSDFLPVKNSDALVIEATQKNPGVAFLASAILPGSGQALNGKWIRAGIYFTAEVLGVI